MPAQSLSTYDQISAMASDYYEQWKVGAAYLLREASASLTASIQANPQQYQPAVSSFEKSLQESRQNLDRIRTLLPAKVDSVADQTTIDRYAAAEAQYRVLSEGFYTDTQKAQQSFGFIPIMYVGYLAIGATAATFAVSAYQYATNLREQTALQKAELEARVVLAEQGKQLPGSTLPADDSKGPVDEAMEWAGTLAKLVAVLGAGYLGMQYFNKK